MAERVLVAVAVIALAAIDVLYLELTRSQGDMPSFTPWVVPFVAGYVALMAVFLAASLVVPTTVAAALRGAASAGNLFMGVLAAFSIGVAVLVAAGLAIALLVLTLRSKPQAIVSAVIGALAAMVVLVAGFQVAWGHIECPSGGEGSGTTPSLVGPGSYFECNGGVLTFGHNS